MAKLQIGKEEAATMGRWGGVGHSRLKRTGGKEKKTGKRKREKKKETREQTSRSGVGKK